MAKDYQNGYVAQERLYLTADRKRVVKHDDKEKAFLYAIPGQIIPATEAQQYGLMAGGGNDDESGNGDKTATIPVTSTGHEVEVKTDKLNPGEEPVVTVDDKPIEGQEIKLGNTIQGPNEDTGPVEQVLPDNQGAKSSRRK
jgi:hypothetical protein